MCIYSVTVPIGVDTEEENVYDSADRFQAGTTSSTDTNTNSNQPGQPGSQNHYYSPDRPPDSEETPQTTRYVPLTGTQHHPDQPVPDYLEIIG